MIIFKLNNLICSAQGGEAGGGYTGGGSTGNYGGAATGFGKSGYGSESEGKPGIFGGGQWGGVPGVGSGESDATMALIPTISPELSNSILLDMAKTNTLQSNPEITNALFGKLSRSDAWAFSKKAYSVPTTMAVGWGIVAPMAAGANMMSKVGAALATMSGTLVGQPEGISAGSGGINLTEAQNSQLQQFGINQSDLDSFTSAIGTATPEQMNQMKSQMQKDQDTQAVMKTLGPKPKGKAGNNWQQQFDGKMQMLEKGGRDLFDSAQGMGVPQWWSEYVQGRGDRVDKIFDNPEANVIPSETAKTQGEKMATTANTASMEKSAQAILDADTNIEYNHTLADLSGIKMDEQEKKLLYAQKEIAIDRAITEIEDTFSFEGEAMVAQQIQNLGANALGGTIGQGFVKRWQGREAAAKTGALQDIESAYLSAERQGIDTQKQRQVDIWGKEFEADKAQAGLDLEKAKTDASIGLQWKGLETSTEQANLDRALKERMGNIEVGAWEESNKWSGVGSVAGAVVGSDWFGDAIGNLWS